jgi:hypothetical protein
MDNSKVISKTNASFPDYLDFKKLRAKGIKYCQTLASDLWTDYNLHDPGITILEVLCYALTDLGYRTSLPIEDLLARSPEQKVRDKAMPGDAGKPFDDNFFSAEQILTCNPVTLLDLRKLLIDIPGVRNAWIELADPAETAIYQDDKTVELQHQKSEPLKDGDPSRPSSAIVKPDGLYIVRLELEDDMVADACGVKSVPVDRILGDVRTILHRHRNLCEDFLDIVILDDEQVALCVDIEIDASANPEELLLQMVRELEEFLSPTVKFYSLQEMLARGKRIEEIYEGRPLAPVLHLVDGCPAACSHGFIDTDELKKTDDRSVLQASDIYHIIMRLSGVLAVRNLMMVNYVNDTAQTSGEKWCLQLTPKHRQHFDLQRSRIRFFKEQLPFSVDKKTKQTVQKRFLGVKAAATKSPLEGYQLDRTVPEGKYRHELQDFRSIMLEFPSVYGIGDGEIPKVPKSEMLKRKAQVHQLRAYLLFYDQILVNYLAQLANLRELFSMRADDSNHRRGDGKNHTYFAQILSDVPGVKDLLRNYKGSRTEQGSSSVPDSYPEYLDFITESSETYSTRRNSFLDHLLARFAESFTDYVLLMYEVNGQRHDTQRNIRDKTGFLLTYPETSRNRGKGFDYSDRQVWNTNNVSGLERRVARLLGLGSAECQTDAVKTLIGETYLRRNLCNLDVVKIDGAWYWSIELELEVDPGGRLVLKSRFGHLSESNAETDFHAFIERARELSNYRRIAYSGRRRHGFGVLEPLVLGGSEEDRARLADYPRLFPAEKAADLKREREKVIAFFADPEADHDIRIVYEFDLYYAYVVADIPELGPTEFRIHLGYLSAEGALEAANLFVAQASNASEYEDFKLDNGVHCGFAVTGPDEAFLVTAGPWPTLQERELWLYQLVRTAAGSGVQSELFQDTDCPEGAYRIDIVDASGAVLLVGTQVFPGPKEAGRVWEALAEFAAEWKYYRTVESDRETARYSLELTDQDGQTVAWCPRRLRTLRSRDDELRRIVNLMRKHGSRPMIKGIGCGLGFRFKGGGGVLTSVSRYPDAAKCASACARVSLCLADPASYTVQQQAAPDQFCLVVSDADGVEQAASEPGEKDFVETIRDKLIALAQEQTLPPHAIEPTEPVWRCRLINSQGRVFLEGVNEYQENTKVSRRCDRLAPAWADGDTLIEQVQRGDNFYSLVTVEETGQYSFELLDDPNRKTIARHPEYHDSIEVIKAQFQAIDCLVNSEGFHLVEHLLLRPKNEDAALPLIGRDCPDTEERISFDQADPYSFRATVVVPYWPKRFRKIEFRSFFERTLRMETPAHVYLRICWVDARHMRSFERAYRRWLRALAHPTRDCDLAKVTDELLCIIFHQLRSVYKTARLSDGVLETDAPPFILNKTILGTGGN